MDEESDSDATNCDSDWMDDVDVYVVPDSLCSRSSVRSEPRDIAGTKLTTESPENESSEPDCSPAQELPLQGDFPDNELPVGLHLSESPISTSEFQNAMTAFDEHLFNRPNFTHSPINKKTPLVLSSPGVSPCIKVPAGMNQYLRDYQQEGVAFLYSHYTAHSGAVLCDDMGLGKTIQVIAFMSAVLEKSGTKSDVMLTGPRQRACNGCFLVICPSSVVYNWTSEIETWSHLKHGVYHRTMKDITLERAKKNKLEVVVTTHETARAHVDDLNAVDWLAVVCDEVQVIKGVNAQVTGALNSLAVKRRYGLTGTALQNNLTELWSILNWANPGCLGSLSKFQSSFERPILEGQKYDCTKRQLALSRQKLFELEEFMKKWVLRRTKSIIASQLPKKEEVVVFCPITELQETIYQTILDTEDVQLILHSEEPCDCYNGHKRGECCYKENQEGVAWQKLGHAYAVLLTKCANHLGLLLPSNTTSLGQKDKATRVCEEVFAKHPQFTEMTKKASFLTLSDTKFCGKMQVLEKLLCKFKEEKAKVIIFSMSVKLLNIVENYIVLRGYTYCRLDGSTKLEDRTNMVHIFNTDPQQFIFLISKKCGGVGLNITGANRVVIYDPSWNPATDLQAEDRAFRIGQSRDVKVYRLITEGTVEEMIYLRQVYKQQLANMTMEGSRERRYFTAVAGDRTQQGELFGYCNLFPLRRPGQPGYNLTMDILKRANSVESGVIMAPYELNQGGALHEDSCHVKEVRDSPMSLVPGTTTIAHSGGKSVIGNSKVEEHISKQAMADVYEHKQHSQEPANFVSNKLEEFSDESDDVDFVPTREDKESDDHKCESSSSSTQAAITSHRDILTESQDRKSERHEQFEKMAVKFGFPTSHDFALHVKSISKVERTHLLNTFYETSSTSSTRGKSKVKREESFVEKLKTETNARKVVPRKQLARRGRSSNQSRKPLKRKCRKPLEFVEEDLPSPQPSKRLRDRSNSQIHDESGEHLATVSSESILGENDFPEIEGHSNVIKSSLSKPVLNDSRTNARELGLHRDEAFKSNTDTQESETSYSPINLVQSSIHKHSVNDSQSVKTFTEKNDNNSKANHPHPDTFEEGQHTVSKSHPKFVSSFNIDELFGL